MSLLFRRRILHTAITLSLFATVQAEEPAKQFNPLTHHHQLTATAKPALAFRADTQFDAWQPKLRSELTRVLALPSSAKCPLDAEVALEQSTDDSETFRVVFQAEPGVRVPCYLVLPKKRSGPLPVMICLQGHKKIDGMLVSLGRVPDGGGRDIAVQAVKNGWAALAVEQRCFGERKGDCQREFLDALMLGRTLTGERVYDVMRAIDFIESRPELDKTRIGCMGNSTGGTVTFYAACVDPRIRLSVVSCSYCTYAESWMKIQHCACGYLPGILKVADMGDLAGLVAPRNLLIVAGKEDYLATIEGVHTAFAQTKRIFTAAKCADNVELIVGDGGHQFYPDLAWPRIQNAVSAWGASDE